MRCCYPPIYAAEGNTTAQDTVATQAYEEKVSDPNTFNAWYDTQAYNTATTGRIWADKTVDTEEIKFNKGKLVDQSIPMADDADFQVALSALSSTSNTSGYTAVPLDIVLVLDVSGSMEEDFGTGSQTKLDSLKVAVNNFLDEAAKVNNGISDNDKKINVSLVKFAGKKNVEIGDKTYRENGYTYNYSQIVTSLTSCDNTHVNSLKSTVNRLNYGGATQADYGLELAQTALSGSGSRKDANKIVIFFTDGSPTSSDGYEGGVAHDAIQKAQQLKTSKVQIYTIGIFDGANSAAPDKNSSAENTFMHAVSSNYPNAECKDTKEWVIFFYKIKHDVKLYTRASKSDFYKTASNAAALTDVFKDIFTEVSSGLMGPTHVEGSDPSAGGYVTFYDRLGDFMEVKSIDGVAFADTIYEASKWGKWNKNSPVAGTDTFEFKDEEISNGVSEAYPQHANLNKIKISIVRGTGANGDYVTVRIPASMLPLRKYTVATTKQGETKLTVSDTFPINILYSVGLRKNVRTALENGTSTDAALVEYVKNNAKDGKISFYSNKYSGKTLSNGTVGDTTATFVPASSNSFYYHTVDTPLYKSESLDDPLKEEFKANTPYYYALDYYEVVDNQTVKQTKFVKIEIAEESAIGQCIGYDEKSGQAYIKKNTLKGSMPAALDSQLGAKKDADGNLDNRTGTADRRIDFKWEDFNSSTAKLYLGNNGRITYDAKGSLKIQKVVNAEAGLTPDANDTFMIKVDLTGADGSYKYTINGDEEGTIKSGETLKLKANEVAEIVGLPAGCTYTVTEPEDNLPAGYTKDGISIDNRTGTITAGLVNTTAPTVTVTNTYTPTACEAEFKGKKNFVGRNGNEWLSTDKFDFILTPINNAPMPADVTPGNTKTVTVDNATAADDFSFGNITFTQPGTYRYTIREDKGTISGVSYDGSTYTVTVEVQEGHDTDKGKLVGTVTYEKNSSAATNGPIPTKAEFTNTYEAKDEKVTPVAFKNYVDDSGSTSMQDKQFSFTLTPASKKEDGTELTLDEINNTPRPSSIDGTNDVTGRIAFGSIQFKDENIGHDYYYIMQEPDVSGSDANIIYSDEVYLVKYTVNDNTVKGTIEATPTYYKLVNDTWTQVTESEVIFTNTYNATPVDVQLGVHKQLDGRPWQAGDDFTFTLTAADEVTPALDSNTYTTYTTETTQSATFPAINYTKIGTYTYEINETFDETKIPGVTAGKPVTVTVTVTNNNGKLEAAVNYSAEYTDETSNKVYAKYINTYSTLAIDYKTSDLFHIYKKLEGRDWTPNDSFEFILEGDSDSPMPDRAYRNAYATNTNDSPSIGGDSTLQFTAAGKYNYYISEVQGNQDNGLTYDTTRYKVVVTVDGESTADNTVQLKVGSVQYFKGTLNADGINYTYSDTAEDKATFENHYDASIPAGTTFTLTGYKSLLNRPANNGEFHFTLTDITNGPDNPGQILYADNEDGMFTFNVNLNPVQTTYTELLAQDAQPADNSEQPASAPAEIQNLLERRYILAETVPADTKGVTYDTTTYLVIVPLKDDGNGKLYVDNDNIKYYRNGDKDTGETPNLSFANSYTAESVTLPITARKELSGRALQADEFTFQLKDAQGKVLQTVQNKADGSIHFSLRYDDKKDATALESDNYTYTISEVAGSEDTIAYDAATYTFTVKVTDNGDGKLVAELDQPQDMVFRNSYTPKPTPTPTVTPTPTPSAAPTAEPTAAPTPAPTTAPAAAPQATPAPTDAPTATPTASPAPTATAPAATATPASVIPRTADSFPLALLIGLAIVSCGALGILYTAKKRRK